MDTFVFLSNFHFLKILYEMKIILNEYLHGLLTRTRLYLALWGLHQCYFEDVVLTIEKEDTFPFFKEMYEKL